MFESREGALSGAADAFGLRVCLRRPIHPDGSVDRGASRGCRHLPAPRRAGRVPAGGGGGGATTTTAADRRTTVASTTTTVAPTTTTVAPTTTTSSPRPRQPRPPRRPPRRRAARAPRSRPTTRGTPTSPATRCTRSAAWVASIGGDDEAAPRLRHVLGRRADRHPVRRTSAPASRGCRSRSTTTTRATRARTRSRRTRRSRAGRRATATATSSSSTTPTCKLYELFYAATRRTAARPGTPARAPIFDLRSNALRPDGWTSADAAGLPIFPGLVRYDEVVQEGVIDHALRFTISRTQRGLHPPGDALRVVEHRPERAADGRALPHEGVLRLRRRTAPRCR